MGKLKIVNLIENECGDSGCIAEHGLSFYFETDKHKILMDAGASNAFIDNAKQLGIRLEDVDVVILSHGHYDHTGGVIGFSKINPNAPIYMQESAGGEYYSLHPEGYRYIGIDKNILRLKQIELIKRNAVIDEELSILFNEHVGRLLATTNLRLKQKVGGKFVQDDFGHEQYLVVNYANKKYLFSGCAHKGILNILNEYKNQYHCSPDVVVSGFHYMKKSDYTEEEIQMIENTARELLEYDTEFYTCHCTGEAAYRLMKNIMGQKLHLVRSGDIIEC